MSNYSVIAWLDDLQISAQLAKLANLNSYDLNFFEDDFSVEQIRMILDDSEGITLLDDIENNVFPEPLISSEKNDLKNNNTLYFDKITRNNKNVF